MLTFLLTILACLSILPPGATVIRQTPMDWVVDVHTIPECHDIRVVYYTDLPWEVK